MKDRSNKRQTGGRDKGEGIRRGVGRRISLGEICRPLSQDFNGCVCNRLYPSVALVYSKLLDSFTPISFSCFLFPIRSQKPSPKLHLFTQIKNFKHSSRAHDTYHFLNNCWMHFHEMLHRHLWPADFAAPLTFPLVPS